jgi:alginate O-acetyltransferase complex protein AlgI
VNSYSPLFLFLFLPLVLVCYWPLGRRGRTCFLLFASFFYYVGCNISNYAWEGGKGGSGFLLVLIYYIIANYFFGIVAARYRETTRGRYVVWLSLAANLGPLVWYKYSSFAADLVQSILTSAGESHLPKFQSHLVPLGISFITFQAIAYVLDVSHGKIEPQRDLPRFALFLALFPKILAGPIVRYSEVGDDLDDRKLDLDQFAGGIKRFIIGLGKKALLADTLAETADQIFALPTPELAAGVAWLGLVTYTLQIYLDFSGYTDMAIGLGRMFGFRFQENFNYPYISRSLTEFWRRWHISLSTWFRDYLFIPLSYALMTERVRQKMVLGKYRTNYRSVFSIIMVFTLCGLWHGAGWNFIVWGMLHGIVLAVESLWLSKVMNKWWVPLQHCYLLLVVMLAWVFFRMPDLNGAAGYLAALAGLSKNSGSYYSVPMYLDKSLVCVLAAGIITSMPVLQAVSELLKRRGHSGIEAAGEVAGILFILVLSFASIASSTFTPFLYQKY